MNYIRMMYSLDFVLSIVFKLYMCVARYVSYIALIEFTKKKRIYKSKFYIIYFLHTYYNNNKVKQNKRKLL